MGRSLLDQIESEALDGDVVKALRLCITLGGHSDSAELRDWAARELRGYGDDDELPEYRRISAPLCIDHASMTSIVKGQHISVFDLPEFVRERISEKVELPHSIPELLDAANSADRTGESLRLLLPRAADLVAYMNGTGQYSSHLHDLYWKIPPTAMRAVVERVCTDVVGWSERCGPDDRGQGLPSPHIANQAFNVVVKGTGNRVVLKKVRQESKSSSPRREPRTSDAQGHGLVGWDCRSDGDRGDSLPSARRVIGAGRESDLALPDLLASRFASTMQPRTSALRSLPCRPRWPRVRCRGACGLQAPHPRAIAKSAWTGRCHP